MKTFPFSLWIIAALICFPRPAFSTEQPFMEAALGYLQAAVKPKAQLSPLQASKGIDRLGLLKSAKEALSQVPSIYKKGQKAAARKLVDLAIIQLEAGEEAKAMASAQSAIAQVRDGIESIANRDKNPRAGKNKSDSSDDYFGKTNQ